MCLVALSGGISGAACRHVVVVSRAMDSEIQKWVMIK